MRQAWKSGPEASGQRAEGTRWVAGVPEKGDRWGGSRRPQNPQLATLFFGGGGRGVGSVPKAQPTVDSYGSRSSATDSPVWQE